ncbi:hypothetical protein H8356DRAFT_1427108 [Neocallimastix lanati (nom. inval.)]|nr:hypothetical protein H8356DRAFT_1427108 [Neocallimastix sp. JGI-2020a]
MNSIIIKNPRIPKKKKKKFKIMFSVNAFSITISFAYSSSVVQGSPTNLPQCPSIQSLISPFSLNTHLVSTHLFT